MASQSNSSESIKTDIKSVNADGQADVRDFGTRLQIVASEKRVSRSNLQTWLGIPKQTFGGYWHGERYPPADLLVAMAEMLDTSPNYLVTGREAKRSLVNADEAGWLDVAEYDLREMTDQSLGAPSRVTPVREDWLYSTFRARSGLWLTRMLSDYQPADLSEGTLVICQTVRREDLAEGHVCLWRVRDDVIVGRFSVLPDAALDNARRSPTDPRMLGAFLDPALGVSHGDLLVPPSAIDAGRYHLVGRVLGSMVRPL